MVCGNTGTKWLPIYLPFGPRAPLHRMVTVLADCPRLPNVLDSAMCVLSEEPSIGGYTDLIGRPITVDKDMIVKMDDHPRSEQQSVTESSNDGECESNSLKSLRDL